MEEAEGREEIAVMAGSHVPTGMNELARDGSSACSVLGAALEDAGNPVKVEKKKGNLLERLGRGHDDEIGMSGQDTEITQRESREGKRET